MSVLDYIDADVFTSVYQNKLPNVASESIDAICRELYYAIQAKEPIFVYGDYDMDGFCAAKVWDEVLASLYDVPAEHFLYMERTHNLDPNILGQVRKSKARVVIVCDTGSSLVDREVEAMLLQMGKTPVIIDHHEWQGSYTDDQRRFLVYNSHEENTLLGGCEISGAYASLLVARRLCEHWFNHVLSHNACVYALISMYSDVVDLATPPGRALYNIVSVNQAPGPKLLQAMNEWSYCNCRRLYSFILSPKMNACFRTERFGPLNQAMTVNDRYGVRKVAEGFSEVHSYASKLVPMFTPMFERERYGDIVFAVHEVTDDTKAMHVRNFSGLIANTIAREEKAMVIAVIKDGLKYEGSFRDFYNRRMLDTFGLFCEVGGHGAAFGLSFANLAEFRRHLSALSQHLTTEVKKDYNVISSSLVKTEDDVRVLALYNEYMNVRSRMLITHRCSYVRTLKVTKYSRFYDLGLPYNVKSSTPLLEGSNILLEPTISRSVELRCVE